MEGCISPATTEDLADIAALVNSAYRGDEARKGWTHEADLIEGALRTDEASLAEAIENPDVTILKYEDFEELLGCVYLEQFGTKAYLGMLSVSPALQAKGIGHRLLQASEQWARDKGCDTIEMTVISVRKELIAWYERKGYHATGEKRPFHNDGRFGMPKKPIEFIVLEKRIA